MPNQFTTTNWLCDKSALVESIVHQGDRGKKRQLILDILGNKCCRCGFSDYRALQIDHVNGNGAAETRGLSQKTYLNKILRSLQNGEGKYQLLCANCNWIKRYENNERNDTTRDNRWRRPARLGR